MEKTISSNIEPLHTSHGHILCWKSVFAGVIITLMSYMILTALGAGVAGLTAARDIQNESGGMALATGAGLWLGLSALISLFLGSYFTLRISKFVTNKVGAAHAFVVASIFFMLMGIGATSTLGSLSTGAAKIAENLNAGAMKVTNSTGVQDAFNRAFGGSTLKDDPSFVVSGLATRLLRGQTDSAKAFFAYETGQSEADATARFEQLQNEFMASAREAGVQTSRSIADAGWSLFVTLIVGLIAAVYGGRVGAQANASRPLVSADTEPYLAHAVGH